MDKKPEPISWWVYRDLEGNALEVTDEQPTPHTIEAPNGVHIGKIVRPSPDMYAILKRIWPEKKRDSKEQFGPGGNWVQCGSIHRITKAEFETYRAFGLFEEDDG